ncbi:retrovirus-related pol polyprotein from transposon TNT 1-94 [Tanacetum coccineum]
MLSIAKFDVKKIDGSNDFGLWRVKMRCLLNQHGWEAKLDPFPGTMKDADKTAALKTDVYKKAHIALLLCLDNKVLREVNKEDSAAGVWLKLKTLYMTKSLANKLYLKKKLFTFYMHSGKKLSEHIDEFNKLIGDLANIDVDIDDEDQALMLLTLNSRELKKRTDAKDDGGGLYDHLKKDYPKRNKKKSIGFVKKNAGQGSSMHSEGYENGDLLMAVLRVDHGLWKVRVQMKDGSSFVLENVRYILELKRNLISLGTLDREGYTVKLQNRRVKVIKGSLMVLSGTMKGNCVYSLDGWAESGKASVDIQEKESLAQVWHKCLGHISEAGLHELERREVLGNKGLGKLEFCENCVLGKSTRNGLAERMNRMLLNKVRCFLIQSGLPDSFWAEATVTVAYLISRSPSIALEKKTPMDLWSGHPANYEMLRIFGIEIMEGAGVARFWKEVEFVWWNFRQSKVDDMVAYAFAIAEEEDTHEPITFRAVILSLIGCEDYELEQLDVKMVFFHGNLEETIYMRQPPGFEEGTGNKVCLLKKSLYGLKQSPRQWYKRFDVYMISNGFSHSSYDSCVYFKEFAPGMYIYLLLYVDDMLIACKSKSEIEYTKGLLRKEFDMKEPGFQTREDTRYGACRDRSVFVPLGAHFKVSLKDCPSSDWDVERMSKVPYVNVVGSLMYLMVCTRPDITYAVSIGTAAVSLVYGRDQGKHMDIDDFVDADYAKDPDKEAEYMKLTEAVKESIWLKGLLIELGVNLRSVVVNCDNQSAIHLSRNAMFHERTKHINVRYHFIREIVESKEIEVAKIGITTNLEIYLSKS